MTDDRHQTDTFDLPDPADMAWRAGGAGGGGSYQRVHPPEPEPPTQPRVRVKRRPNRRYSDPHEMWDWHWCRMRIVLAWTMVGATCSIVGTASWVILGEFV